MIDLHTFSMYHVQEFAVSYIGCPDPNHCACEECAIMWLGIVFTNLGRIRTFAVKVIDEDILYGSGTEITIPDKWEGIDQPPSADHEELRENLTHSHIIITQGAWDESIKRIWMDHGCINSRAKCNMQTCVQNGRPMSMIVLLHNWFKRAGPNLGDDIEKERIKEPERPAGTKEWGELQTGTAAAK